MTPELAPAAPEAPVVDVQTDNSAEETKSLNDYKAEFLAEMSGEIQEPKPEKSQEEISRAEQRAMRRLKRQEMAKKLDERERRLSEKEAKIKEDPISLLEENNISIYDWAKKQLATKTELTVEDKIAQLEAKLAEKERLEQEREVQLRTQQIQGQVSTIINTYLVKNQAQYPYLTAMIESGEIADTFATDVASELLEMSSRGELPENVSADDILASYEKYYQGEVSRWNKIASRFQQPQQIRRPQPQSPTLSNKMTSGPKFETDSDDPKVIKEQLMRQHGWLK